MVRVFEKGIDEVAQIDVNKYYSFVSIGKDNIKNKSGFAVKTVLVSNSFRCITLLNSKTGKGWKISELVF